MTSTEPTVESEVVDEHGSTVTVEAVVTTDDADMTAVADAVAVATTPATTNTNSTRAQIPEGMSKKAWKKQQRKLKWEESKEDYKQQRREKKKKLKQARKQYIQELVANGEEPPKRDKIYKPEEQNKPIARILIDCEFDQYMNEKEILSLSAQVTRSYAANRRTLQPVTLEVSSFGERLKKRFDDDLPQYHNWDQNIKFSEENLETILKNSTTTTTIDASTEPDLSKFIYLTADTEDRLETLEPDMTYILGGIVDKGRHKRLCLNKAQELGLTVKRLPIDEFIQLSGRQVLATSHVFELLVKWFEFKDWKKAFESVIPERKLVKEGSEASAEAAEEEQEVEESEEKVEEKEATTEDVKDI